ncbi:DNA-binding MurR/RpiR family transcriptional regulator [Streptomyces sp. SAI-135]|uniref:MurR/RpiR family transcriptional regulator n=1 Tax=unclassified Streptomyces TaxID=2593676 RepID=UPI002474D828|nr:MULTISPECIES: MurR/RpiR family transcriptional regulator [unclassified Streptomyces]MDH6514551.1 DNA-binding MurR/RpiR family transcriptional regulator [Streptomyces sp. SAI-090]MDH6546731.1 DNA-binding MurR/RpiR family transcriptional regulator [Streptomyces sp. SAI-041]MDH6565835.1 DNA-binding MurR/RpiR family transcriptional regulator [Streptomyces sp. SAI-117]MDH6589247.1 DNA-binding MurR/RpiR family transcriptional regulator [Streptomyces sp. SAI-133]MDH6621366.1 DNA-binding MurR/RpiR 
MSSPQQARAQASAITSGKTAPETEAAPASQLRTLFDRPRLSPGQRRIAQYLIEHITEAAFLSITDLAERVGVSQPSVTRFAAAVGFSGYPALREKLQSIALGTLAGGPVTDDESRGNELQAAVDAEIENLENLRRDFADPDRVIQLGRDLSGSTPLTVLGLRISASLAEYFAYAARRIHPDVRLVTRGGSVAYDALLQSREAGGTWVLAFSMPRHAQETLTALRVARSAGLRIALVTDLALGHVADEADVLFSTGTGSRLVFDSYAAPGVIAAALLQAMTDADPERTQARLEEYEQISDQHQFFLRD